MSEAIFAEGPTPQAFHGKAVVDYLNLSVKVVRKVFPPRY